jgi:hypothetical protein
MVEPVTWHAAEPPWPAPVSLRDDQVVRLIVAQAWTSLRRHVPTVPAGLSDDLGGFGVRFTEDRDPVDEQADLLDHHGRGAGLPNALVVRSRSRGPGPLDADQLAGRRVPPATVFHRAR